MRLKFLLRPGWIGLILLVAAFSAVCFTLLAPWQFDRNEQAQDRNAAISESFEADPRPLREVLPGGRAPDEGTEWSQVTLRGHYLPEAEMLAWQRTVLGEPAFEVLTPLRTTTGETVLVNRGFIRPVEGTRAPEFAPPPSGEVSVVARARADEHDREQRPPFSHDGHRWVYAVDSGTVAAATGLDLHPGYFMLGNGEPGVLEPLPLPRLESGPYFSYALQWITFGVMAIGAIGYLIYSEVRPSGDPAKPTAGRTSRRRSVAEAIAEEERREAEEQDATR